MQPSAEFLNRTVSLAEKDPRIVGVALHQASDQEKEFTNTELVLVCQPEAFEEITADFIGVAEALGPLLQAYEQPKGEGEKELTCLYDEPLQRVDLRLLPLDNLSEIHHPSVLWDREDQLRLALSARRDPATSLDLQWMEDRFWLWLHSAATALKEGAVFEAHHLMSCMRSRILAPLVLKKEGLSPAGGLHELEKTDGENLSSLRATVPLYDARSCEISLREAAKLYVDLRETLASVDLVRHRRAEMAVMRHLHTVTERLSA